MSVCRVEKTSDYTVMSNYHLKDKDLSLKAKGLLSLVLSLPEEWDYSVRGLVAICKEQRTAVESTLQELKKHGYLVVTKLTPDKTNSGRFEYEYIFYENPKQEVEKQGIENLHLENLGIENQPQLNTNRENTKKVNKDQRQKKIPKKYKILEKIPALCLEYDIEADEELELLEEFFRVNIDANNMVNEHTIRGSLNNLAKVDTAKQIATINMGLERGWKNLNPEWLDNSKVQKQEHLQLEGQSQEAHLQYLEEFRNSKTKSTF